MSHFRDIAGLLASVEGNLFKDLPGGAGEDHKGFPQLSLSFCDARESFPNISYCSFHKKTEITVYPELMIAFGL